METDHLRAQAVTLLTAIWRGMDSTYKARYRQTIWRQFEDEVKSSTYTNNLGKFVTKLCDRLNAQMGMTKEERADCVKILNAGHDHELLNLIRNETSLVVLMVRVALQEKYATYREFEEAE
jgi:hypothetical protein